MVEIIDPYPFSPLSEKNLVDFESQLHSSLPSDFRDFLLQYNGGHPEPSFFWIEPGKDGSEVFQFYGLHDGPAHLSIQTYAGVERYGIQTTMLPIGDDGVGNSICLDFSTVHYGEIYFLDHETHPFDDPDSMDGMTKLADSFTEFLTLLSEDPE